MKTIYSLLYGMLVLFSACGQSKVQEKFDTITTYSYTNSYGKDGRLAEVLIKQQSQFLENGAYISGRAVEITQRYNYPDNDMKPETAYKLVKVWSLSNATIMTLLFIIQCDSLWHAFCVIFTIPLLGIGTIVMYENQSNDYTALKENLTEKKKKEMPYIRWDEVIKDARKDYLWGVIGSIILNILYSGFIIFILWMIIYEGVSTIFS